MRKVILALFVAVFLMAGCAALQPQPQLRTYTFNYDGNDYSALLPEQVPMPPESAQLVIQCFPFAVEVCTMHIWYGEGKAPLPMFPVASFWFAEELDVIGLVWHTLAADGTIQNVPFLYVRGLPVLVSAQGFDAFLNGLQMSEALKGEET